MKKEIDKRVKKVVQVPDVGEMKMLSADVRHLVCPPSFISTILYFRHFVFTIDQIVVILLTLSLPVLACWVKVEQMRQLLYF